MRRSKKNTNGATRISTLAMSPWLPTSSPRRFSPSDDELRSYYESHKTDYRYLEPQKKVRYLFVDTEKVGSKLQIPDADLKTEYDGLETRVQGSGRQRSNRSF